MYFKKLLKLILKLKKYKSHQNKSPILINNIDISKVVVSKKLPFREQDFRCVIYDNRRKAF